MSRDATIRPALPEDLDGLLALETAAFGGEAFSRRQLRYLLTRAKGTVFVAEDDGAIAGYLSLLIIRHCRRARIYSLAVAAAYRGRGIAGRLVDQALAYAAREGLAPVFLEVGVENHTAIALYEKKGFTRRMRKPGYYKDGSAAFSMMRRGAN
jgi:Acetyltransferases